MNDIQALPNSSENSWIMYAVVSREALAKTVDKKGNLELGKIMVQAQHANLHSFFDALDHFPESAKAYRDSPRAFKSLLVVDTEEELRELYAHYALYAPCTLVEDAGLTVYDKPTVTMVGIGPIRKRGNDAQGPVADLKTLRTWKKEEA